MGRDHRDRGEVGATKETVRRWFRQAEIDAGVREGRNLTDVELATAEWIDWYNHQRLRSAIGYATPADYEQQYWAITVPTSPQATT